MKKFLMALFLSLIVAGNCFGQSCETTIDGNSVCDYKITDWYGLSSAPALSSVGTARVYFDFSSGKLKCSEDGNSYANCVGSGGGSSYTDSQAQVATGWTDGGSNVYLTTTADLVGVGTTTPSALLHISSTANQTLFRIDDNGSTDVTPFIVTASGNVGIGTFLPNLFTVVNPQDNTSPMIRFFTNGSTPSSTSVGDGAMKATSGSDNSALGRNAGAQMTSGARNSIVGVNTLGNNLAGSDNSAVGYLALSAGIAVNNSSAVGSGALKGNAGTASNNTAIGYQAGTAIRNGTNNVLIGYSAADTLLDGSNNIVLGYDLDLIDNTSSNQLNIGNLLFGTAIDGTGNTLSTGNIGVGTFGPKQKLDVVGTVQTTGFKMATGAAAGYLLTSDSVGLGTWTPPAASAGGSGGGWTDGGTVISPTTISDTVGIGTTLNSFGTSLSVIGGTVGIGTWNPAGILHIKHTTQQSAAIVLQNSSDSATNRGEFLDFLEGSAATSVLTIGHQNTFVFGDDSAQTFIASRVAGEPMSFMVGGFDAANEKMRIQGGGMVGIGTVAPSQKLDVAGTAQMTGFKLPTGGSAGYLLTSDSVGVGTWTPPAVTGAASSGGWTDGGTNVFPTATTDFIGIGTTTPSASTTVEIVRQSGNAPFKISPSAGDAGGFLLVGSDGRVGIGTSKASINTGLAINNGNVGIGTWDATAPLFIKHVVPGSAAILIQNASNSGTQRGEFLDFQEASPAVSTLTIGHQNTFIFGDDAAQTFIASRVSGEPMTFIVGGYDAANEVMRLTSGANVGIGTTVPPSKLYVKGGITSTQGSQGQTACWRSDNTLGYCSSIVGAGGGCTCN